MTHAPDPFAHHPELRGRIACSESSFFRTFDLKAIVAGNPSLKDILDWAYSAAEREEIRERALAEHSGDLWVFAYGSLMWDPALRFGEVRRAYAAGYARRFILKDDKGGRGTKETPGLMAALDLGAGCDGLVYRIAEDAIDVETEILFRREMIGPGYRPDFIPVRIGETTISALSFLADHASGETLPDLPTQDQAQWIAAAAGILGSSREYLMNVVSQLSHLGIEDVACSALLRDVDAILAIRQNAEVTR
jgi:cation transport protein ChaC